MTQSVVAGAIAVAVLNAAAGLIGAWFWYDGAPGERAAGSFWLILRVAQGSALALALAVGSLAAAGNYSTDDLFYLYALLPSSCASPRRRRSSTSATSMTPRQSARCPSTSSAGW